MAVIADIIDGTVSVTDDLIIATRTFVVTNLASDPDSRLVAALLAPGIPAIRDAHPNSGFVVSATRIDVRPRDRQPDVAEVVVTYTNTPDPRTQIIREWSVEALQNKQSRDRFGNFMTVIFDIPGTGILHQGHHLERTAYMNVARITKPKLDPQDFNPITLNTQFSGKINSVPFGGFAPQTVLCRGFTTSQNPDDGTYSVTAEYAIAPPAFNGVQFETSGVWKYTAYANINGFIYEGVTLGDGIEIFEIYDEIDMNLSGFPIS